eukprot:6181898-Pleurochrysis_carterae.AAC.4
MAKFCPLCAGVASWTQRAGRSSRQRHHVGNRSIGKCPEQDVSTLLARVPGSFCKVELRILHCRRERRFPVTDASC